MAKSSSVKITSGYFSANNQRFFLCNLESPGLLFKLFLTDTAIKLFNNSKYGTYNAAISYSFEL